MSKAASKTTSKTPTKSNSKSVETKKKDSNSSKKTETSKKPSGKSKNNNRKHWLSRAAKYRPAYQSNFVSKALSKKVTLGQLLGFFCFLHLSLSFAACAAR